MNPRDLRVVLAYLTAGEAKRRGITDPQPGFYVEASENEGYANVLQTTRVSDPHRVEAIADAVDGAVGSEHGDVRQAVRNVQAQHDRDRAARRVAAQAALEQAQATLAALDAEEAKA